MTLKQRCVNTAATLAVRAMAHFHWNYGPIRALANKHSIQHLPGSGPSRPLLLLVNFDWALEPARPIGPAIKYLGPLMPREPAELPEDLRAWLEGSEGKEGGCNLHSLCLVTVMMPQSSRSLCNSDRHSG